MKPLHWLVGATALTTLSIGVTAQSTHPNASLLSLTQGSPYVFVYKPTLGVSVKYSETMHGIGPGDMKAVRTILVTDAGSGNYQVVTVREPAVGAPTRLVEVIDKSRNVISTTLDGKSVAAYAGGATPRDMMPIHPIKVGESWTASRTFNGKPINAQYKLEKVEKVDGVDLATVDVQNVSIDDGKILDTGSFTMEPATGLLHDWILHHTMVAGGQTRTIDITLTLQP
jgi:hypothetical protein